MHDIIRHLFKNKIICVSYDKKNDITQRLNKFGCSHNLPSLSRKKPKRQPQIPRKVEVETNF